MYTLKMKLLLAGALCVLCGILLLIRFLIALHGERRINCSNPHPLQKKTRKKQVAADKQNRQVMLMFALILLVLGMAMCVPRGKDYLPQKTEKTTAAQTEPLDESMQNFDGTLSYACLQKDMDSVKQKLNEGADPNEVRGDVTPLFYACRYQEGEKNENALEIVQLLLAAGADLTKTDSNGVTPLMYSVQSDTLLDTTVFLVENGLDVNATAGDMTALNNACFYAAPETVCYLLSVGAKVSGNYNPIGSAVYPNGYARHDIVSCVVAAGADTSVKITINDENGENPKEYTVSECIRMDRQAYIDAGYPPADFGDGVLSWEDNYEKILALFS